MNLSTSRRGNGSGETLKIRLAPLRQAFGLGTFPVVVNEALELIGISAGPARSPVGSISPENREKLRQILQGLGPEPGRCRDDL